MVIELKLTTITDLKKQEFNEPHSLAMAFARRVLPHPGGPYNSTPEAEERPFFPQRILVMELVKSIFIFSYHTAIYSRSSNWLQDRERQFFSHWF